MYDELHSGKRSSILPKEIEWVADYERSLIPVEYVFPRKGDVYESIEDQDVKLMIWYNAPGTGGDVGRLFKGDKVWIYYVTGEKDIEPFAHPIEYKKLEDRLVSKFYKELPFYAGYSIAIRTTIYNEKFKLVMKDYKQE